MILGYPQEKWILAMATGIGAYGGFPKAPPVFEKFKKKKLVQWLLVFVLLYQGGGSQDIKFTISVTIAMYIVHMFLINQ